MRFDLEKFIPSEYTPKFRLKLHVVFWSFLFTGSFLNIFLNINGQSFLDKSITTTEVLIYTFVNTLLVIGFIMSFYFLYSKYFFQLKSKINLLKVFIFIVVLYIILYVYSIFTLEVLYRLFSHFKNYNYIDDFIHFSFIKLRNSFWYIVFIYLPFLGLPLFLKYLVSIYYLNDNANALIIVNKKNEIQFLKDQIQPHFVFNMLNGVYSLVVDSDPKSSNAILRLSEMLRFSLYQSNQDFISLKAEIEYIQNRIEIEKIYNGFSDANFNIHSSSEDLNSLIKPMIIAKLFDSLIGNMNSRNDHISLIISNIQSIIQIKVNLKSTQIKSKIENEFDKFKSFLALQYPQFEIKNEEVSNNEMSFEINLKIGE
jgi:two-component system, LytTR family, sensor kinase